MGCPVSPSTHHKTRRVPFFGLYCVNRFIFNGQKWVRPKWVGLTRFVTRNFSSYHNFNYTFCFHLYDFIQWSLKLFLKHTFDNFFNIFIYCLFL